MADDDVAAACLKSNDEKQNTECNGEENQNCIPLERYIEQLKSEDQKWKDLYQETRKSYGETLRKLKLNPLKLDWESCVELLTEEEKAFLTDRPDTKRIKRDMRLLLEKQQHCTDVAMETTLIMDRIESFATFHKNCVQQRIVEHAQS